MFGLFSSKRKIFVSSAVYNLAGDEEEIPDYLKTTIAGYTLGNRTSSIAEVLSSSYLNGPGTRIRGFYNWSDRRYPQYGFGGGKRVSARKATPAEVLPYVPIVGLTESDVRALEIGIGRFDWWVERWILDNYPEYMNLEWTSEMPLGDRGGIYLHVPGKDRITVPRQGFSASKVYLYLTYLESTGDERLRMYIYEHESGIADLDALMATTTNTRDYYPVMPIRLDNKFVGQNHKPLFYEYSKKALKKVGGIEIEELIEKLADNDQLSDLDYVFVVPGVSLNTKTAAGMEYIYRFLSQFPTNTVEQGQYQDWQASMVRAMIEGEAYDLWLDSGRVGAAPIFSGMPSAPNNTLRLAAQNMDYSVELTWRTIKERVGNGQGRPGAKVGDLWWDEGEAFNWGMSIKGFNINRETISGKDTNVSLYWQDGVDSWRALDITGLVHKNLVYKDKFVEINASEALADDELSGFIVPLKQNVVQAMSMKQVTELSSSCLQVLINVYEVKKIKWYQRGFFKFVLVVAIVATIAFTGGFRAAGVGVLGTNLAVGTALGLSGIAAIVAGVVANAVAAMIITAIITKGATAILGEEIGQIVGMVASFIAISAVSSFATTGSFALNFSQLSRVENILKMTSAVGSAAARAVQAETAEIIRETQELVEKYETEMDRISKAFAENIGYGNGIIDPMQFLATNQAIYEKPEEFLQRTLMTGSDIANLSMRMVSNFADISLDLNKVA